MYTVYRYTGLGSGRIKYIIIIIFIAIIISTALIYSSVKTIDKSCESNNEDDLRLLASYAGIAWRYFQPGVGVNPDTGLHYAKLTWHGFTDWDLASYILAVLDAGDIGLINITGEWGVKYRLEKILDFLVNRELNPDGIPYWGYNADTGKPTNYKRLTTPSDAGRLLIALYKIKERFPEYSDIIDYIVYVKTGFDKIASDSSLNWGSGFYLYYIAQGFKLFGFDNYDPVRKGLNEINKLMNGDFVNIYGVDIPVTYVTSEPIVHGILDLNLSGDFRTLADRVYEVQELRYKDKGRYTAFSEGVYSTYYIYEWIVQGSPSKLWTITMATKEGLKEINIPPVIFTKIGISFLAIYHTEYARKLAIYVASNTVTDYGFCEGIDEEGMVVSAVNDKTNSMIINAARYAGVKIGFRRGYNLTIRVLDWDGEDPIEGAHVYVDGLDGYTDSRGLVTFQNVSGEVKINITYLEVPLLTDFPYKVVNNSLVTFKLDLYDVNLCVYGFEDGYIVNASILLSYRDGFRYLGYTDEYGMMRIENIPVGSYELYIYDSNQSIILGNSTIDVNIDEETIYLYLNNSFGSLEIKPIIIIYP